MIGDRGLEANVTLGMYAVLLLQLHIQAIGSVSSIQSFLKGTKVSGSTSGMPNNPLAMCYIDNMNSKCFPLASLPWEDDRLLVLHTYSVEIKKTYHKAERLCALMSSNLVSYYYYSPSPSRSMLRHQIQRTACRDCIATFLVPSTLRWLHGRSQPYGIAVTCLQSTAPRTLVD